MPRKNRIVLPGYPHHVVQRGNRRMKTFFNDDDYCDYLETTAAELQRNEIDCLGYCLMPNHVHMILVPSDFEGMSEGVGEAHRLHALRINRRMGWRGHLWQDRFYSYVMSELHLVRCARYIELTLPERRDRANAFVESLDGIPG